MSAKEVRNIIIRQLTGYLNAEVYRAGQVSPEAAPPYVVYSVTSPYIPDATMGHMEAAEEDNGAYLYRRERAGMSLSFTACSRNRTTADGQYILGEDEAMDLAERAQGWFLHAGRAGLSAGGIVVEDVNNVQQRNTLMVDEEANRYGFDVLVRYIREDRKEIGTVEEATVKGKEKVERKALSTFLV